MYSALEVRSGHMYAKGDPLMYISSNTNNNNATYKKWYQLIIMMRKHVSLSDKYTITYTYREGRGGEGGRVYPLTSKM